MLLGSTAVPLSTDDSCSPTFCANRSGTAPTVGFVYYNKLPQGGHSMSAIVYEADERQEETVSAFLMLVLEYALGMGLFALLEDVVHVQMKQVRYTVLHKAQTVIASLVMGCAHTKAINDTLGEEVAAANYLGMRQFPEQSQINRYLTRFSAANVDELGTVHERVPQQQLQARRTAGLLVVDIDRYG